jgi:pilus assembly protein CpaF
MTADLIERVRRRLVDEGVTRLPDSSRMATALRDEGVILGDEAILHLVGALRDDMAGLGPLQQLVLDSQVTDVLVNGPEDIWVDRGAGLTRTEVRFPDNAAILRLAQRLAAVAGRRLDEASPFVDAQLPDGTRLHAVIPPVALSNAVISLRIPHHRGFSLDDLIASGTVDASGAEWLSAIVSSRMAFLISGGTGSGKTTLLSTLLGTVDDAHRILIIEDSAELAPHHPHVIRLQSRPANLEGAGVVTMRDLVRQALRMRPDRVVVGEVRGAEVIELLASMNTGHEGGCGTVHANSPADVPARLEALGLMAGLPRDAVHSLIGAGVQCLIHLSRGPRRISAVHVVRLVAGRACAVPALVLAGDSLVPDEGFDQLRLHMRRAGVEVPR